MGFSAAASANVRFNVDITRGLDGHYNFVVLPDVARDRRLSVWFSFVYRDFASCGLVGIVQRDLKIRGHIPILVNAMVAFGRENVQ